MKNHPKLHGLDKKAEFRLKNIILQEFEDLTIDKIKDSVLSENSLTDIPFTLYSIGGDDEEIVVAVYVSEMEEIVISIWQKPEFSRWFNYFVPIRELLIAVGIECAYYPINRINFETSTYYKVESFQELLWVLADHGCLYQPDHDIESIYPLLVSVNTIAGAYPTHRILSKQNLEDGLELLNR